ncbi:hypothetical protein [Pseudoalteromonas ruthenica]|uniref:hypothetical protein n=1 Tax=Pseudoalteromonas ruthenica TaxID=151081 RepID=UPI00110ACF96|nr:hypothetical protein [Pseudoalteromonas ruthenica]
MSNSLYAGDKVNYHSIVDGQPTSFGHTIKSLSTDAGGEPVAYITGKAGYVSVSALSLSTATMTVEWAKEIHAAAMNVMFAINGIEELKPELFDKFKTYSLSELLRANAIMSNTTEPNQDGGFTAFVTTSDEALAEGYIRVNDASFVRSEELTHLCDVMDDLKEDSGIFHAILIDGHSNFSLATLCDDGVTVDKTILVNTSAAYLKSFVRQLAEAEK